MAMKALFGKYRRVHLIGIGGVGMEGLARVLAQMGCQVSGSDRVASRALDALRQDGFVVHVGHRAAQVAGAELVVYSSAIPAHNEELVEARRRGVPAIRRAELLGELTRFHLTIGVAGSHGKTTTASMIAGILRQAGLHPSVLIGGWRDGQAQATLGQGRYFVVEADEFDRTFLKLYPSLAVVTSVDAEHLDCYRDLEEVEEAFRQYLARLPFYGHCVLAGDGRVGRRVREGLAHPCYTCGLGEENDFRASAVEYRAWGSRFVVEGRGGVIGELELQLPGEHNVRNALAATALTHTLGVDFSAIATALRHFGGVARRFERKGEVGEVLVVDDYAHHPTEIAAALAAARGMGRRIVAAFQPHLYSRTRDFYRDFARELAAADQVFLAPIYAAREEPMPGIDAGLIARAMQENGYAPVAYVPEREELLEQLEQACQPGDLVITLGAGDLDEVAAALVERLRGRAG